MGAIANLFGYVLNYLYNLVQNYGWAIIIFSVLLKLIMLPLTIKQQKTMKKTAKVQDELKSIQVKYRNDPEKLNRETIDLYKREKISPFSGCLSSILQLLIFLSLFYLVSRPLTYMKKIDPEIIEKYRTELSDNGEATNYPEIKIIEKKSSEDENIYINMNFLGLDLSKIPMQNMKDFKVYIIPALYIITTFINIKLSVALTQNKKKQEKVVEKKVSKDGEETTEEQIESMQQMSNSMNYMMPIMSIAIAIIAPLGLSLYWFMNNILQLIERVSINFFIKDKKVENS